MLNKFLFWLWHREIAQRLRNNPVGAFIWETRVQLVYKPLFEKEGLQSVYDEHARHVAHLTKRVPDAGDSAALTSIVHASSESTSEELPSPPQRR